MNSLIRIAYAGLNSLQFFVWAFILSLDQFGIMAVALAVSAIGYNLIDFGQTQKGPSEISRLAKRNFKMARAFVIQSIKLKLLAHFILSLIIFIIFLLSSSRSTNLLIILILWQSVIGSVICAPWIAVGYQNKKYLFKSSLLPRTASIAAIILYHSIFNSVDAISASIIHAFVYIIFSLIFSWNVVFKGIAAKKVFPKLRTTRMIRHLLASSVSLASQMYSPLIILVASNYQSNEKIAAFTIAEKICKGVIDLIVFRYQYYTVENLSKQNKYRVGARKILIESIAFSVAIVVAGVVLGRLILDYFFDNFKSKLIYESLVILLPLIMIVSISGWLLYAKIITKGKYENTLSSYLCGGAIGLIVYYALGLSYYKLEMAIIFAELTVLGMLMRLNKGLKNDM